MAEIEPKKPAVENKVVGEGIRSVRTTSVFRAVNFELYAKPVIFSSLSLTKAKKARYLKTQYSYIGFFQNKYMMIFGVASFTFCVGYMIYMQESWRKQKVYTVINDDDELVLTKKKSRWD
jgi:hypothetical protein